MFPWKKAKKEKSGQPFLTLYDAQMDPLFEGPLNVFAFPEDVILAGSEEFFNDPTPCEIHRRAVQLRFYAEIEQMLPRGEKIPMAEVPENLRAYFQEKEPAYVLLDER